MNIDTAENCGGYDIKVTLIQGDKRCTVSPKDAHLGIDVYWIGTSLGNCSGYKFNSYEKIITAVQTDLQIVTFCPLSVFLTMTNPDGIETKFCSKMNNSIWYSMETNEKYHSTVIGDCPEPGNMPVFVPRLKVQ